VFALLSETTKSTLWSDIFQRRINHSGERSQRRDASADRFAPDDDDDIVQ